MNAPKPSAPDDPDKSAFADDPFSGSAPNLNESQNLLDQTGDKMPTERQKGAAEMVGNLLDRFGD